MFEKFYSTKFQTGHKVKMRSLGDSEPIHADDLVEDLASGKRLPVARGPYNFLRGQRAGQARMLPQIFDVVRVS